MLKSREFLRGKSRESGFSLVARNKKSVAYGNKVMDTRLPQPAGCGDKYDVSGWCLKRGLSAFNTFAVKAMSILAFLCLFSTAAEAKICFLPVDGCDTKIITKVKDDNASSCQYDSKYKAEQGISACEIAYSPDKRQINKKCWYRMCNTKNENIFSTYEDCKNNLTGTQKCESCGSCYKRVAG